MLTIRLPLVVINGALVLVILLLLSPLGLGYLRLIYQMTAGEEPFLSVIFDPLRSFRMTLRSIWATLLMLLMDAVSLMVCCLPGLTAMFAARVLPGRTGKGGGMQDCAAAAGGCAAAGRGTAGGGLDLKIFLRSVFCWRMKTLG